MQYKLVSPYLFVLGFAGYMSVGLLSFPYVSDRFSLYPQTFLYLGVGLACFVAGCQLVLPDSRRVYYAITLVLATFFAYQEYHLPGLILPFVAVGVLMAIQHANKKWFIPLGVALILSQLVLKGIPALNPELRQANVNVVFIAGYIFIFLGLTFMAREWDVRKVGLCFAITLVLLALFTYRVYVLELILVVFVSLYMLGKIRIRHIFFSAIPLFLLVVALGYLGVTYQDWKYNALELLLYRSAFTFGVINSIVQKAGWWGITHGGIWLHFSTSAVIGPYLFGYPCNITSTIMGPMIFDGGILELGWMGFFGAGLNTLYRKALKDRCNLPYYAIVLAIFLMCIDASFFPSIVLLFFAALYLASEKKKSEEPHDAPL
ncbi:MAG: hypothetical protein HXS41_11260 [Theionarchaea archaeon]|nr:hypothetical protein [Theionarchaea archaeon]